MRWVAMSLAGPGIWAVGFSTVYAVHGIGCAFAWPEVQALAGVNLHHTALWLTWIVALAACGLVLILTPAAASGPGLSQALPRIGAWIGLGATVFTLIPVVVASSC